MSDFADAQFEHKPSGYIFVDGIEVAHTKQCCHCGIHFISRKGSGKIRAHCRLCNKITCGAPACDVHVPFQAKLDFVDGGGGLKSNKWDQEIIGIFDKYGNLL
jgi:hypothetical protein